MPTYEEIEAAKTSKGGWTKEQLAEWGVSWPPPKGWRQRITCEVSTNPYDVGSADPLTVPTVIPFRSEHQRGTEAAVAILRDYLAAAEPAEPGRPSTLLERGAEG